MQRGKLIGDFTIARAAAERFLMWGSSQAQIYHMRWFERHLPRRRLGHGAPLRQGLWASRSPARARASCCSDSPTRMSRARLQVPGSRAMDIANVPAMVNRVTYTGDLGYEIWVAPEYQRRLYRGDHGRRAGHSGS